MGGLPGLHAIDTARSLDMATLQTALGTAAPVMASIPNWTNTPPLAGIREELV